MSRTKHLVILAFVAGVSIVFGMLLTSGPLKRSTETQPAVWSPALAAPPAEPAAGTGNFSFADVAEKANPAVVSVSNVEFKKASRDSQFDMPFEDPFRFFFGPRERDQRRNRGQDEEEERLESGGSGFVISEDGYILTNNHVVENASKLKVSIETGVNSETYDAKLVGKDKSIDLALIKINPSHKLPTLSLGDSDALRVGEWVVAIGNPLNYEHTVTVGVVSGKGRRLQQGPGELDETLASFIQTDAAINFGNSGGPLLNIRGQVVGINTAITRNYGPFAGLIQGIGFALPINQARTVLDQLKQTGRVARGYLGISIGTVKENEQKAFNLPSASGALVEDVIAGLPGDEAGLKRGDVIVSVNGASVKSTVDLINTVSSKRPGETVALGIIRDGREMKFRVRLADRSNEMNARTEEEQGQGEEGEEPEGTAAERLGIRVTEITPELRKNLRRRVEGVVVLSVKPSGKAWDEGLRKGMIITSVNNTEVRSARDLRAAIAKLRPGDYVRLYTLRQDPSGEWRGSFVIFQLE